MLRESEAPVTPRELEQKCLLRSGELAAMLEACAPQDKAVPAAGGSVAAPRQSLQKTAAQVLAAIEAFHSANPQRAGHQPR